MPSMLMNVRIKLNKVIWLNVHMDQGRTMKLSCLKVLLGTKNLTSDFHEMFKGHACFSRLRCLHESCSTLSLEKFCTNFSFIG